MDLNSAITAHAQWRTRFRAAIICGDQLDVASIAKDNSCALGKWLHGDARTLYAGQTAFGLLLTQHAQFHAEAAKVAAAINAKQFEQASALLDPPSGFATASVKVEAAIRRLQETAKV
ncbi:MAG: CZB domain-containing protein [Gemmatimonadaceae bacterium]|nr:CZB domain-containing protein [Gemmatimonadaceae bacterium]